MLLTGASTAIMLIAFGKGMFVLRGADVLSHMYWSTAALITVLAANFVAMVHAAQSDRLIRELRHTLEAAQAAAAVPGAEVNAPVQ